MRLLPRKRPRVGALLLVALLLPPLASADAQDNTDPPKLALRQGAWALQFSLASGLSLTALSGAFFFGKYHLSPRSALRLGLGFGARFGETDSESTRLEGTDEIMGTSGSEEDYTSYSISMEYLFYPSPRPGVNLFLGVGPTFSIWDGSNSSTRTGVYPVDPMSARRPRTATAGAWVLPGFLAGSGLPPVVSA